MELLFSRQLTRNTPGLCAADTPAVSPQRRSLLHRILTNIESETIFNKAEEFAVEVVTKLRAAGFQALWAGGCVRDRLLGRHPKDFDVATNATPPEIRQLFGHRRTLALGEAFGVIVVLGPDNLQIEVATFRQDADYSDGRRPDSVTFCSAEEDARRRDFTINGLFFDPITETVTDYVGGQADLRNGIIRAIGQPEDRFNEDKLRMLRAVRFAAVLDFEIEPATFSAVKARPRDVLQVSAERITAELRQLLTCDHAARGVRLLLQTGLLETVLAESGWRHPSDAATPEFQLAASILSHLPTRNFSLALAALVRHRLGPTENPQPLVRAICRRWKTTNAEESLTTAALKYQRLLCEADRQPWSVVQPILIREDAAALVDFAETVANSLHEPTAGVESCRAKLQLSQHELNPPPILTGEHLKQLHVPPGAIYKKVLSVVRARQLDGTLQSSAEAIEVAQALLDEA